MPVELWRLVAIALCTLGLWFGVEGLIDTINRKRRDRNGRSEVQD